MLLPKNEYVLSIVQLWRIMQRIGYLIYGAVLISGILIAAVGEAATYYVATTGNDSNSCSQAQSTSTPRRTIATGLGCVSAGDTLYIRAGTYTEEIAEPPGGSSTSTRVTIAGYPGETVRIKPNSGAGRVFHFRATSSSYITLNNLIIDATNVQFDAVKISSSSGGGQSHHIRIQNSEIVGVGAGCQCPVDSGQGIIEESHDNEFINLHVHGNWGTNKHHAFYIKGDHNLLQGNHIHDVPGFGIHIYNETVPGNANTNTVVANRIHNTGTNNTNGTGGITTGLLLSSGVNNIAYNNIVYNNKNGILIDDTAEVYNNTIYNNTGGSDGGYCINNRGGAGTIARNNICYRNGSDTVGGAASYRTKDSNLLGTNPSFVNPGAADFRLQSGSPAIDTGVPVALVTTDFAGAPRPQGGRSDIGAYEYTSNLLVAPSNLRVLSTN